MSLSEEENCLSNDIKSTITVKIKTVLDSKNLCILISSYLHPPSSIVSFLMASRLFPLHYAIDHIGSSKGFNF